MNNSKDDFYNLTPVTILNCAETVGLGRATGRIQQLNSMENRVYEVELESGVSVIGKFYRAGRWDFHALKDEHDFLKDLIENEIPAVAALPILHSAKNKSESHYEVCSETIGRTSDGLYFAIFPKVRGRAPDELDLAQAEQLGRLVARMHSVGKKKRAEHRLLLNVENFGERPLDLLLKGQWIAIEIQSRYEDAAKKIFEKIKPLFANLKNQRIHGDCHRGNLLFSGPSAFFLDFDDMVEGPAVQDVWLATPEPEIRESFLIGYESMLSFDRVQLKLIEPLRALRIINYSAWIAKRWEDPYFKRIFTEFKSYRYWASEVENLELVARLI